jgi:hypothetical protein
VKAAIEQVSRLGGFAASHQSEQQHVFDDLPLRAAAADARNVCSRRLQDPDAFRIIGLRECDRCAADGRYDGTGRERAIRDASHICFDAIAGCSALSGRRGQQAVWTSMKPSPGFGNRDSAYLSTSSHRPDGTAWPAA